MASNIQYNVLADVIDLRKDQPKEKDAFLVDTNVWLWMTYSKASRNPQYQATDYPNYISKVKVAKGNLYYCGLSIAELAHVIEKTEKEIYEQINNLPAPIKPKEYRHNYPTEHSKVEAEIESSYDLIKKMANLLDLIINASAVDSAFVQQKGLFLDGYDLLLLEAMKQSSIHQIITDDWDFATVPNILVFTANRNIISAARQQSKLIVR